MSIFIANCTKQTLRFCFRAPEERQPRMISIPSGTQDEIGKNWNMAQTESVVRHMERYGYRPAPESNGRMPNFSGVLYRIGKPITETQIVSGHDALVDHQERRSAQEATRAALAFDSATREKGGKGRGRRLARVTEVSVEQDVPRGQKPTGDEVKFSVQVTPEGDSRAKLPV